MKSLKILLFSSLSILIALLIRFYQAQPSEVPPENHQALQKPNILFLLADDLGYNDFGANNNNKETPTPNMNQLAAESLRFTRFYTESTCSPSRAALLTGRYPARAGFRPDAHGIPTELTTLPEALHAAGYSTHHVGKWHVGSTYPSAWPNAQGFDTTFGFIDQWSMRAPNKENPIATPTYINPWLHDNSLERKEYQGHLSDILAEHTVKLIKNSDRKKPWFIYHAFFAPHAPIQPAERFAKQFPDTPVGRYHALVNQLDSDIGQILQALKDSGQVDNTIVVLASDNGGTNKELDNNFPFNGSKATYLEGGIRTPLVIRWPKLFSPGGTFEKPIMMFDLFPTLAHIAGANIPENLDGVDVVRAMKDPTLLNRSLFWEGVIADMNTYGVLADQRWRLYRLFWNVGQLYDLQSDPSGHTNIIEANPEIARKLQEQYTIWRNDVRRVDTIFTAQAPNGQGILTGNDFQRSPGLSGYTFAIGIRPIAIGLRPKTVAVRPNAKKESDQHLPNMGSEETIAEQKGLLYIGYSEITGVTVKLENQILKAPILSSERCNTLVITSNFIRRISLLAPENPQSTINLFVNGKLVDTKQSHVVYPPTEGLSEPTYIGINANKNAEFSGSLTKPTILNQELFQVESPNHPGLEELNSALCGTQ